MFSAGVEREKCSFQTCHETNPMEGLTLAMIIVFEFPPRESCIVFHENITSEPSNIEIIKAEDIEIE